MITDLEEIKRRLRGAGNAINAEATIAWIKTVMECIDK